MKKNGEKYTLIPAAKIYFIFCCEREELELRETEFAGNFCEEDMGGKME